MAIKKQTFMNGVLIIMFSQVLIKLLGFIYRIILTNFPQFADEGNSYYGSGFQVYTLILAIATMGIPNTISKLVSEKMAIGDKRGAHRIFRTAMVVFTSIAVLFALGLFFGADAISTGVLKNPGVKYTLMALSPAIIFVAMSATMRGYFVGMQNMTQYSKTQIIEQIVNSVFSVIFVVMLLGATPEIMAAGSTLATTVAASVAFAYLLRYYNKNKRDLWKDIKHSEKFALEPKKKIAKKLISYAIPLSFASVVVALSGVIDIVTVMDGLQKFGYDIVTANEKFGILLGKVDILNAIPLSINVAFSVALVPFISSAIARHRKDEAVKKINYSLKISSLIALPCAAGLFILAEPIFQLVFPNATAGARLLQIQCWMIIFAVIDQTLSGSLQGLGKLYVPGACLAIGAILKYILNVTLIPIYGEVIPAITTIVYNFTACALCFIILFRTLKQKPNMKELFVKPIFATICMSIITFLTYKLLMFLNLGNAISTISSLIIAFITYGFCVIKFHILNAEELKQLPFGDKLSKIGKKTKKVEKNVKKC
ncbi:MAG: polysaccharide biosynthesis protein [Clostridia bacterium]|nr:polysaccharide biosynthesis protein [Clostridia bacterium]